VPKALLKHSTENGLHTRQEEEEIPHFDKKRDIAFRLVFDGPVCLRQREDGADRGGEETIRARFFVRERTRRDTRTTTKPQEAKTKPVKLCKKVRLQTPGKYSTTSLFFFPHLPDGAF